MSDQDPVQTPHAPAPPSEDAGSQALSDALRSSFFIVKIIMVILILAFLSSGFFVVGSQERAIILRLGRPVGEGEQALLKPGAHWALPRPLDEIERIPYTAVQEAESSIGWYLTPEEIRQGMERQMAAAGTLDPASSSYALSSDTNIVHVRAVLRYRIVDPISFHFNYTDAPLFVTNDLNNSLLEATRRFSVDDVLTRKITAFKEAVGARFADLVHEQGLGISVDSLDVEASPPTYLLSKFNEVDTAVQKRNTAITQAQSYENTKLAAARGTAAARTNAAEAARSRLVEMVSAQAKEFTDVRSEFEHNPLFFEQVRQMVTLERVYTNAQEKILEPHQGSPELRLNLGREPQGSSTNTP